MTNNKQQTAVEWYIEKLLDFDYEYAKGLITLEVWSERKKSLIEQAKEMEKERMIEFANDLLAQNDINYIAVPNLAEQYYNETYGGCEQ